MPKVSVICISKTPSELDGKAAQLRGQTLQDFEFIGESGGTIPEAWNRAIQRSTGEILVFTETDAQPIAPTWLEELVNAASDPAIIVKGLEVTGQPWDLSNLACHRLVLQDVRFDESFRWAEDTELFCRLKSMGYRLEQVPKAPVIHLRKSGSKRAYRRAFRYGVYQARLHYRYGPDELASGLGAPAKLLAASVLRILGLLLGYAAFWPERRGLFHRRSPACSRSQNNPAPGDET
jgi:hypothetical protein